VIIVQLALRWLRGPAPPRPPRDEIVGMTRGSLRVRVNGRLATVGGELLARTRGEPSFVAYRGDVRWDDGGPLSDDDRQAILGVLEESSRVGRFVVEIE
jgi:hypothetical protein